jgi:hypothetical protein
MSNLLTDKQAFVDKTRIGECAAQQPVSGVSIISGATAQHGYAGVTDKTEKEPAIIVKLSA